jgi:hypothetical protein
MPLAHSYDEAKTQVEGLVERFARNREAYKRTEYKEAQARVEFIDPLFEALGWDVRNTKGYAEQYKDVVHEDALKVGGAVRAPDYCFRVGGTRKFFLEAKKPSVSVKGDVGPAYQLRRYAWSAKLPLSVLTDFEEFAVYDCQRRPKPADKDLPAADRGHRPPDRRPRLRAVRSHGGGNCHLRTGNRLQVQRTLKVRCT